MLSKIGRLTVLIVATVMLWPASVSWAGDRSLESMRAKDYIILEGIRLKGQASQPILAAMETGEAIPEDELGALRGGFDTFFLLNISGAASGGTPTGIGLTDGSGGGTFGISDEEAQSLTVVGDFNGGCCFFQINQATNSDGNVFTNVMNIDIALVTVADTAQLNSLVNTVQNMIR